MYTLLRSGASGSLTWLPRAKQNDRSWRSEVARLEVAAETTASSVEKLKFEAQTLQPQHISGCSCRLCSAEQKRDNGEVSICTVDLGVTITVKITADYPYRIHLIRYKPAAPKHCFDNTEYVKTEQPDSNFQKGSILSLLTSLLSSAYTPFFFLPLQW